MVAVNIDNFIRAEMDQNFSNVVEAAGGTGVWAHDRQPIAIEDQFLVRMNRDTPHSQAVFDLTTPVTIVKPDTEGRFQTITVVNQDHYMQKVIYDPGRYTLTQEEMGTRYVWLNVRTLVDPNDPEDLAELHRIQDQLEIIQESPGELDLPAWDRDSLAGLRKAISTIGPWVPDNSGMFGKSDEVDPVRHFLATAVGPGGNKPEDAIYLNRTPDKRDGKTAYTLTLDEVPVDGFWSISLYNEDGYFEAPAEAASTNSLIAQKNDDGSTTIHFGGDSSASNYLRIMPGWSYMVRLYRPRQAILDGSWVFPEAKPVE